MERPLYDMPADAFPTDIRFLSGQPHICDPVTTGYWLLFRKTVWTLDEDFVFSFVVNGTRYTVTLKVGFKSDLTSTPKLIYWIYPPWDNEYGMPALAHDGGYGGELFPRWFIDLILREAMKLPECNAGVMTQDAFYASVRTWGWTVWNGHTEQSVADNRKLIWVRTETDLNPSPSRKNTGLCSAVKRFDVR